MGNYLSPNEQQLYHSLGREYFLDNHPFLLHRSTNQFCTLHKITTYSEPEASKIRQIIEEYDKSYCQSISKLKAHFFLDMRGYCSDEQNYYLIFEGKNNYTLKDQLTRRRFNHLSFREQEAFSIVQVYVCGLRQYYHKFQRDYNRLSFQSIAIDQAGKMLLKDPWLNTDATKRDQFDTNANLLQSFPSPEKLLTAFSSKMGSYNEFDSNLFTVGVIGLQVMRLDEPGSFYLKKQINLEEVRGRLREIKNDKLRIGLACLLDLNPNQRKNIYSLWDVENKDQHFVTLFGEHKNSSTMNVSSVKAQQKLNFQNHDLFADTRRKFNFATSIPKSDITKQSTRQLSPINHNAFSTMKNTIISNGQGMMHFQIQPETLHGPSPPKPIPFQTVPKISFNDSKPTTAITTPQTNSLSNSAIANYSQPLPSTGLISFKDFVANEMKSKLDFKNYTYTQLNHYENSSSIQQMAVAKSYDPIHVNHLSSGPTNIMFTNPKLTNAVATFKKQEGVIPAQKYDQPSISPIFGTTYKQSFIFYDTINQPQNNNTNNINESYHVQAMQNSPKIEQKQVIHKSENNFLPPVNPVSPAKNQSLEKPIIKQEQSPIRNQDQLITDYLIQDTQNDNAQQMTNDLNRAVDHDISQDNQQTSSTPCRPTTKHKYNSTIIEMRDEESIDQSCTSDQPLEEQYVVEGFETGSRYEGYKSNGLRNGRGKFYYQDGGYYDGMWKNNQMDGYGKLYYEGGALAYEGNWVKDEFSGMGKVYNDHPVQLTEPFDYTDFDMLEDYWLHYEGMLMKDTKEGRGKIRLCNGELFEGDFHVDRIQGFGKFHTLDGKVIQGIWRESKLIKVINSIVRDN